MLLDLLVSSAHEMLFALLKKVNSLLLDPDFATMRISNNLIDFYKKSAIMIHGKKILLSAVLLTAFQLLSLNLHEYAVDFDISMGKNDRYERPYYTDLMKNLTNPDARWFRYLEHNSAPAKLLTSIREAYEYHKLRMLDPSNGPFHIPRTFHHIWLGKKPFPEKYKDWQKTWQNIPGWEYKLWTDADVESLNLFNKELFYKEKNLGARADILRMEILYRFGGVYIDTDFECIKPDMFDILHQNYDFYCGLHPLDCLDFLINNAIIGSVAGHPILKACIDNLASIEEDVVKRGPGLFTQMTLKYMNKNGFKDVVFPPTFFYPLGVFKMKKEKYPPFPIPHEQLETIKEQVLKPETIAIHWWDGSWALPDAILRAYKI